MEVEPLKVLMCSFSCPHNFFCSFFFMNEICKVKRNCQEEIRKVKSFFFIFIFLCGESWFQWKEMRKKNGEQKKKINLECDVFLCLLWCYGRHSCVNCRVHRTEDARESWEIDIDRTWILLLFYFIWKSLGFAIKKISELYIAYKKTIEKFWR